MCITLSLCNVIGFDFGSSLLKITLVKPGQPFSIVEDTATNRKTETMLTLNPNEARIMGADSYMEQRKYPETSFHSLKMFVAMSYEHPELPKFIQNRYIMKEAKADESAFIA
jgi:molecular chaperone DnaK (HSP70)